jgi:hypothetical protein
MKDRGPDATDVGTLGLKSVASFFQKAGNSADAPGELQTEHYFLQSYGSDIDRATKHLRGPIGKDGSDKVDMKSLKYNQISNYRFVDISALTNTTQFCTTPVYSFDFKNRQFNVEFKDNSVETARTFISKNYIDNLPQVNRTPQAASSSQNTQFLSPADYQQSEQLSRELEQYGIGPEATKKVAQALKNKTFTPTGFINAIEKAARGS